VLSLKAFGKSGLPSGFPLRGTVPLADGMQIEILEKNPFSCMRSGRHLVRGGFSEERCRRTGWRGPDKCNHRCGIDI
jgi:hypothetical protein